MPALANSEKRLTYRKRVLKSGFIVLGDEAPGLECAVRDASAYGAALQVSTTFGLPARFDVFIEGVRRHCYAQWRTHTQIGVLFL